MVLGDLLVSGPDPKEKHVELPSVGDSREVIEPGWGMSLWLEQKICLVNAYTAVAWSGGYIQAREFLEQMRALAGDERLSPARRQDFFQLIDSNPDYAGLS